MVDGLDPNRFLPSDVKDRRESWKSDARLTEHGPNYSAAERQAFRAGYSDGWYGYAMWSGNERNWHPAAYRVGYQSGEADRREGRSNG